MVIKLMFLEYSVSLEEFVWLILEIDLDIRV